MEKRKFKPLLSETFSDNNNVVGFVKINKDVMEKDFNYIFSKVNIEFLGQAVKLLSTFKMNSVWVGIDAKNPISPILIKTKKDLNVGIAIACLDEGN